MKKWIVFVALLACTLPACTLPGWASKEETLDQLLKRAQSAPVQEQPALYVEAAQRQLRAADELYGAGKVDEARTAIEDVVTYSDRATAAATKSGKKLKHTEISVRKMAERLRDIKRTLAFEDQAPVQAAADHLEKMRTELLSRMFGSKD